MTDGLAANAGWPQRIDAYRTSDGRVHTLLSAAKDWQARLDGAKEGNRLFAAGRSLGESLRFGGLLTVEASKRMPELDEIDKDTKLVIEHWQCRDTPGYQPVRITAGGNVYVHGNAGSWAGPFGDLCSAADVAKYFVDTKGRLRCAG